MTLCFGKRKRRNIQSSCFRMTCSFLYILPGTYEVEIAVHTSPTPQQGFKEGDFKKGQPQRGRSPICGSPFCPVPEAHPAQNQRLKKTNQIRTDHPHNNTHFLSLRTAVYLNTTERVQASDDAYCSARARAPFCPVPEARPAQNQRLKKTNQTRTDRPHNNTHSLSLRTRV